MLTSIGICTCVQSVKDLNYEKHQLYQEAKKVYDTVLLIDPIDVTYQFIRGEVKPIITLNGTNLSNLNTLIIRSTRSREISVALLARSLTICGCLIPDPISRFAVGRSSKLLTTLHRFQKGIGSNTFIAFTYRSALDLMNELRKEQYFPLIAKPIFGKQGKGIELIRDIAEGNRYISLFFDHYGNGLPLLLQTFVEFVSEYRVLLIDGEIIGIVKKSINKSQFVDNAARGSIFTKDNQSEVIEFVHQHAKSEGIIGIDIGIDTQDNIHLIESNYAPLWKAFEQATDINVAKFIIDYSKKHLK